MRVKCLAQEYNTLTPARARTRSAQTRVKRTNNSATAPPSKKACHNYLQHIHCQSNFGPLVEPTNKLLFEAAKNLYLVEYYCFTN